MTISNPGALSISTRANDATACQEGMKFSNQSSDARRSWCVLQAIHTRFSQHPDVKQASTKFIRHSTSIFNGVNPSSPAIMTGSSAKSWLNTDSWLDDRLGPCHHISLVSHSYIFIAGISTRVGKQQQHSLTCFVAVISPFCTQLHKSQCFKKRISCG